MEIYCIMFGLYLAVFRFIDLKCKAITCRACSRSKTGAAFWTVEADAVETVGLTSFSAIIGLFAGGVVVVFVVTVGADVAVGNAAETGFAEVFCSFTGCDSSSFSGCVAREDWTVSGWMIETGREVLHVQWQAPKKLKDNTAHNIFFMAIPRYLQE